MKAMAVVSCTLNGMRACRLNRGEEGGEEGEVVGGLDGDGEDLADEGCGAVEDDDLIVLGAGGELDGMSGHRRGADATGFLGVKGGGEAEAELDFTFPLIAGDEGGVALFAVPAAGGFDEDFDGLADELVVEGVGDAVLQGEQVVVAETFHGVGNVVLIAFGGEGAGARRVLEDETVFVLGLFDEAAGEGVIFVGLGGEADDEVAGKLDAPPILGEDRAGAGEEVEVGLDGVAAIHQFEDAVGAGLGGDVEIAADAWRCGHNVENVVAEVGGVAGDEAETRKVRKFFVQEVEELGEGGAFVFVVVDGLAKERDFQGAGVGEFFGFVEDGLGGA